MGYVPSVPTFLTSVENRIVNRCFAHVRIRHPQGPTPPASAALEGAGEVGGCFGLKESSGRRTAIHSYLKSSPLANFKGDD